ncbi:MAG: rRNA pseudouridine synthase [Caulobacterales bacterium]|nr:rRNA pseudouridine synthase [Caulobacterales bacterium]
MAWHSVYGGAEPVRLNKFLAQSGVCSRREADTLIAEGLVRLDGETVLDAGRKVTPGQHVQLEATAKAALSAVSILLNKPTGFVSGQPEPGKTPAVRLLTAENQQGAGDVPAADLSLPPVGRLDEDSHGLLLLSTDGVVARAVIGPLSELDKEYRVRVRGEVTPAVVEQLRHGLELDGRALKPAGVFDKGRGRLKFILKEGRNRQIRRMCELVGLRVIDLQRTRIGPVRLDDLEEGRWRHLTQAERDALIAAAAIAMPVA